MVNAINLSMAYYQPAVANLCYWDIDAELFAHVTQEELRERYKKLIGTSHNGQDDEYFDSLNEDELKSHVWNELKTSFVVYKSCMKKAYQIFYDLEGNMPASDRDLLAQLRYSIILDEISRVYIADEMPRYAKDVYYVK